MVSRSPTRIKPALLPKGTTEYMLRRGLELFGCALILTGLIILTSLGTYDPRDPSFDNATGAIPTNALGILGAYLSDFLITFFGVISFLPVLALSGWGWRLIRYHSFDLAWLRLSTVPILMLSASLTITALPLPTIFKQHDTYGGIVGELLFRYQTDLCISFLVPSWPISTVVGILTLGAVPFMFGVPKQDGRRILRIFIVAIRWCGSILYRFLRTSMRLSAIRHKSPRRRTVSKKRLQQSQRKKDRLEPKLRNSNTTQTVVVTSETSRTGVREATERQGKLKLDEDVAELPPLSLLANPGKQPRHMTESNTKALKADAELLETVLEDFNVNGTIDHVLAGGPVVTRYELVPSAGTRSARVIALADDIARSMARNSARVAVVPGKNAIGIELPNEQRETVYLRELLGSAKFESAKYELPLALGMDIDSEPVVVDLAPMPHLLVAGTTGSGKSVAINSMILSLLYRLRPEACRLIMIDPKVLELSVYDGIPHLLHPVVTDPKKAVVALKWAVKEMDQRYRLMSNLNVRNIAGYNKRIQDAIAKGEKLTRTVQTGFDLETGKPIYEEQPLPTKALPLLVIVVDEMADLMLVAGKDIEVTIQSLAQRARAAGIHLIIATQRPSVDVITGTIKANLPTRISFQVTSKIDSRTILGEQGAEQLLGMGDMLYMEGGGQITRVHGPFVSDQEVEKIVQFLRSQGTPDYLSEVTEEESGDNEAGTAEIDSGDELYDRAIHLVLTERKASTSFIQRHLQIGYNRAARLIDKMEAEGVISGANHVGKRDILVEDSDGNY